MSKTQFILVPFVTIFSVLLVVLFLRVNASRSTDIGQFKTEGAAEKAAFAQLAKMSAQYPHASSLTVRWRNSRFHHSNQRLFDVMTYDRRAGTLGWTGFEDGSGSPLRTACSLVSDASLLSRPGAYPGSCGQDFIQFAK